MLILFVVKLLHENERIKLIIFFRLQIKLSLVMNDELKAELTIPFSCIEHARIVFNTLKVDKEPRKNLIRKSLSLDEAQCQLQVNWTAKEARILRVSLNSFLNNLHSVIETIQQFSDY